MILEARHLEDAGEFESVNARLRSLTEQSNVKIRVKIPARSVNDERTPEDSS